MAQVTGIVYVKLNGKMLRSKEGAKLELGGFERESVVAGGSHLGYTEKPVPAKVSCTLAHTADTDLIELRDFTNGTVTFETDTGASFLVANAYSTKPPDIAGGGDVAMEFAGDPAEKIA